MISFNQDKLREAIDHSDLDINAIASKINVSPLTLYKYRSGESIPTLTTLLEIAKSLNVADFIRCDIEDFFDDLEVWEQDNN